MKGLARIYWTTTKQMFEIVVYDLSMTKSAASREEVQAIMDKVAAENPEYWPYGCSTDAGPGGEVYLVRDSLTKAAAGFVGWQEVPMHGRKVGSYYVGILPEYRGNGFAKEAVAKIIQKKASGVDEVRAFVMASNRPSKALAKSLGIPVTEKF